MFKKYFLLIIAFIFALLISCDDDPLEPGENDGSGSKFIFYTVVEGKATIRFNYYDQFQIRRYNIESGEDELFKESSLLIGVASNKIYYCNLAGTDKSFVENWRCGCDGENIEKLGTFDYFSFMQPQVSPDGSKFLFHSEDENTEFHCASVDGSNNSILFTTTNSYSYVLPLMAFMPDSKKIAIILQEPSYSSNSKVYTVYFDGSNLVNEFYINGFGNMMGGLYRDKLFAHESFDTKGNGYISIIDFNTHSKGSITKDGYRSYNITFSPNGKKLAFYRNQGCFFIINDDGTELTQITNYTVPFEGFRGLHPRWSADSRKVVFGNNKTTVWDEFNSKVLIYLGDLKLYDLDTKQLLTIVDGEKVLNSFFF